MTDDVRSVPDADDPGGAFVAADAATLTREMVTILAAFGRYSTAQIAAAMGKPPEEIATVRQDPDVLDVIATLRALLPQPGQINELLMSDAERNIRWIRDVRDGKVDGIQLGSDGKTLMVRANMAKALLDRQVAKKVDVSVQGLRTVDITEYQRQRMRALVDGRDDTPPADHTRPPRTSRTDADYDLE